MQGRAHVLGIRLIQSLILVFPLTSYVSLTHSLTFLSIHLPTCNIGMVYSGLTFSWYLSAYVVSLWKFSGDSSGQIQLCLAAELRIDFSYHLLPFLGATLQCTTCTITHSGPKNCFNRGIQICSGRRGWVLPGEWHLSIL